MQEPRTATPSEAIHAVARLLAEVARAETHEAFRAAVEREARALFAVDRAAVLDTDALASGEDVVERSDEPSGEHTLLAAIRQGDATGPVLALTRRAPFTAEDRDLAAAFAEAAGGALAQVRLAEERERRIAQLSALARAAKTVNQNPELAPLLTAICAEARSITGADAVAIYVNDEEGGVVAEAAHGLGDKMLGYRLALGEGLAGRVAQEGRPLAADDYQALASPTPDSPVADLCSAMAVPMYWDGSLRGVLSVGFTRPHASSPEEMRLLETFGDLAAAACRNANAATGLALAARTDALTGCLNHAALHEGLRLEIERCARTDQGLSVVMLDLDEFKQVNERYGHLVGDEVLRRAGHALRSAVRPYDLCARYGGDEFVIVCSDADEEDAAEVATRAMERVGEVLADLPEAFGTGSTAGVARWTDTSSPSDLLEQADRALLYGKQQGHRHEVVLASDLPETFRRLRFRRASEGGREPTSESLVQAQRQAERLQKRSRQLLLASALGTRLAGMREPEAIVKAAA
ncbi:MAG: diguanylate cyclase domain-containing protein, partial [Solirubrobacteraceae bacterium]